MSSLGLLQHFSAIVRTDSDTADDDMDNVGEVVVETVTSLSKLSPKMYKTLQLNCKLNVLVLLSFVWFLFEFTTKMYILYSKLVLFTFVCKLQTKFYALQINQHNC